MTVDEFIAAQQQIIAEGGFDEYLPHVVDRNGEASECKPADGRPSR